MFLETYYKIIFVFLLCFILIFSFNSFVFADDWNIVIINDMLAKIDKLNESLSNVDTDITILSSRVSLIQSTLDSYKDILSDQRNYLVDLNTKCNLLLDELKNTKDQLSEKIDLTNDRLKETNERLANITAECQALNTSVSNVYTTLLTISKDISDIKLNTDVTNEKLASIYTEVSSINSLLNQLIKGNEESNKKLDNIQQENEKTNDFLTKSDIGSSSDYEMNYDTVDDVTSQGFDNIFNKVYDVMLNGASTSVVLPIPFTDKKISINYENVYHGFFEGSGSSLKTLANSCWFFVICYYIVKRINKLIESFRKGDIDNPSVDNVKVDVL